MPTQSAVASESLPAPVSAAIDQFLAFLQKDVPDLSPEKVALAEKKVLTNVAAVLKFSFLSPTSPWNPFYNSRISEMRMKLKETSPLSTARPTALNPPSKVENPKPETSISTPLVPLPPQPILDSINQFVSSIKMNFPSGGDPSLIKKIEQKNKFPFLEPKNEFHIFYKTKLCQVFPHLRDGGGVGGKASDLSGVREGASSNLAKPADFVVGMMSASGSEVEGEKDSASPSTLPSTLSPQPPQPTSTFQPFSTTVPSPLQQSTQIINPTDSTAFPPNENKNETLNKISPSIETSIQHFGQKPEQQRTKNEKNSEIPIIVSNSHSSSFRRGSISSTLSDGNVTTTTVSAAVVVESNAVSSLTHPLAQTRTTSLPDELFEKSHNSESQNLPKHQQQTLVAVSYPSPREFLVQEEDFPAQKIRESSPREDLQYSPITGLDSRENTYSLAKDQSKTISSDCMTSSSTSTFPKTSSCKEVYESTDPAMEKFTEVMKLVEYSLSLASHFDDDGNLTYQMVEAALSTELTPPPPIPKLKTSSLLNGSANLGGALKTPNTPKLRSTSIPKRTATTQNPPKSQRQYSEQHENELHHFKSASLQTKRSVGSFRKSSAPSSLGGGTSTTSFSASPPTDSRGSVRLDAEAVLGQSYKAVTRSEVLLARLKKDNGPY